MNGTDTPPPFPPLFPDPAVKTGVLTAFHCTKALLFALAAWLLHEDGFHHVREGVGEAFLAGIGVPVLGLLQARARGRFRQVAWWRRTALGIESAAAAFALAWSLAGLEKGGHGGEVYLLVYLPLALALGLFAQVGWAAFPDEPGRRSPERAEGPVTTT